MNKIVHIGYHKTGTTFLQNILFRQHPEIFYVERSITQKLFLRVGSLLFDAQEVRENINQLIENTDKNQKALVFSDEELSGNIHTGGSGGYLSKEVADRIYKTMPDAKIVISVRNQVTMIDSVYRQYIKKGGTLSLKKYLFDNGGANHRFPQFSFSHFEYDRLIKYYMQLFGRDNVYVYPYEAVKKDKSLYNDMLEQLGLAKLDNLNELTSQRENPSYSKISLEIARFFNHFYGEDPINKRAIINVPLLYKAVKKMLYKMEILNLFNFKFAKQSTLDHQTLKYIKDYYEKSNQELGKIIGIDLSQYNYPLGSTSSEINQTAI